MLFNPANISYWIFLSMGVLLFLLVIVSGGGDDGLDVDSDVDVDDLDIHTDAGGDFSFVQVLGWLGIGKAPLILLLATDFSLWGVFGWMFNVWVGDTTGKVSGVFLGYTVLFVSMLLSVFMGGLVARPIGKIFTEFGEDTSSDRLIGCVGTVSSVYIPSENQARIGQVDALDPTRNLVTINATLPQWATVIPRRGEKVLVIDRQLYSYSVVAKDSLDQDRWLQTSPKLK